MSNTDVWTAVKNGEKTLKVVYAITCTGECQVVSEEFMVGYVISMVFKWDAKICKDTGILEITFKYAFAKDYDNDENIQINVASEELNYSEIEIPVDRDWSGWKHMGSIKPLKTRGSTYCAQIQFLITFYKVEITAMAPKLFTDTDFTDFCLCTGENKVPVHKAILVAHSAVFKAMLSGPWKEASEGQVKLEGVTFETLKHLKEYMYNGDLPYTDDGGLRPLLLLARYYLIDDLEKRCIRNITQSVKPEKLFSLIEFACQNQIPELPFAILQMTQDSVVNEAYEIKNRAKLERVLNADE